MLGGDSLTNHTCGLTTQRLELVAMKIAQTSPTIFFSPIRLTWLPCDVEDSGVLKFGFSFLGVGKYMIQSLLTHDITPPGYNKVFPECLVGEL